METIELTDKARIKDFADQIVNIAKHEKPVCQSNEGNKVVMSAVDLLFEISNSLYSKSEKL